MSEKTGQLHGRDHGPDGIDPIPGGTGGGLDWGTNTDTDSEGLELDGDGPFDFRSGTGNSFAILSGDYLDLKALTTTLQILSPDIQITGYAAGALVTLQCGTNHTVKLDEAAKTTKIRVPASGGTLIVEDHSGNPVFEVRDDGTVHIKTGGTITADL